MRAILVGCAGVFLLTTSVFALHGHWISHYFDADKTPCCGLSDCQVVHLRVLQQNVISVELEIAGKYKIQLPHGSFYQSEDGQDWWCAKYREEPPSTENTRCAFIAIGS